MGRVGEGVTIWDAGADDDADDGCGEWGEGGDSGVRMAARGTTGCGMHLGGGGGASHRDLYRS